MIEEKLCAIRDNLQEGLDDYTLKTDEEIIEQLCLFGSGIDNFHTADVERLLKEKQLLLKETYELKLKH